MDTGTAYGKKAGSHRKELTEVGAGTPMGELLRRYWHAVGLSSDFSSTPLRLTILGEPLVAFRDGHGKPGLVHPRCAHRGTTLYYGKVEERYGLVFAYLGPPEKKPVLPRYDCLEELAAGEFIEADDSSIGGGGPPLIPCNWLQHWENVVDPFHVPILHGSFSGTQFVPQMGASPKW